MAFSQKFAPAEISRYTVYYVHVHVVNVPDMHVHVHVHVCACNLLGFLPHALNILSSTSSESSCSYLSATMQLMNIVYTYIHQNEYAPIVISSRN